MNADIVVREYGTRHGILDRRHVALQTTALDTSGAGGRQLSTTVLFPCLAVPVLRGRMALQTDRLVLGRVVAGVPVGIVATHTTESAAFAIAAALGKC